MRAEVATSFCCRAVVIHMCMQARVRAPHNLRNTGLRLPALFSLLVAAPHAKSESTAGLRSTRTKVVVVGGESGSVAQHTHDGGGGGGRERERRALRSWASASRVSRRAQTQNSDLVRPILTTSATAGFLTPRTCAYYSCFLSYTTQSFDIDTVQRRHQSIDHRP